MKDEQWQPWAYFDVMEMLRADEQSSGLRSLEDYLREHPERQAVLRRVYADFTAEGDPSEPAPDRGSRLGPYELERELGRGAQGVVYLALDQRVGRRVALKVLRPAFLGDEEARMRMQREAEVASRLHHPGICALFEAELGEDRAYLAMQYLPGDTLSWRLRQTDSDHELAGAERTRWAVDLVARLARALQAAHEAGVVHRDVKPGNVILTETGPVLLDFGLARDSTDRGRLTRTGELFGTPAYMAPEQLQPGAAADGTTDVWALGAILFECLSGRKPFAGATDQAIAGQILGAEPDLRRVLPRDLRTIVSVALEKDRSRRYQTAAALADDLDAFAEDRPIAARPVGSMGRLLRWCRREPVRAALVTALLLALPTIAVLITYAVVTQPEVERGRLAARQERAERLLEEGFMFLDSHRSENAAGAFREALTLAPDSVEARGGMVLAALQSGRPDEAISLLDEGADRLAGLTSAVLLRADARQDLGDTEAAAALRREPGIPTEVFDHYLLAERELEAGHEDDAAGFERAWENNEQAVLRSGGQRRLYLYQRTHIAAHLPDGDRARSMVGVLRSWPDAPLARFWIGFALQEIGDLERAEAEYLAATELAPRHGGYLASLGEVQLARERWSDAQHSLQRAVRLDPDHAQARWYLGLALMELGDLTAAEQQYRAALQLEPDWHQLHFNLGAVLREQGRTEQALQALRKALELSPGYGLAHENLLSILILEGRLDEAEAHFGPALSLAGDHAQLHAVFSDFLELRGDIAGAAAATARAIELDGDVARYHNNLGNFQMRQGDHAGAVASYRRARALDPGMAEAHINLGAVLLAQGQLEEGIAAFEEAVRLDPDHPIANHNLAVELKKLGQIERALHHYGAALEADPSYAKAHFNLAVLYMDLGRDDDAERHLRRSAEIDAAYVRPQLLLGRVLLETGRFEQAREQLARVLEMQPGGRERDSATNWARDAAEALSRAAALDRGAAQDVLDPEELLQLASVAQRLGRAEEATRLFLRVEAEDASLLSPMALRALSAACAAARWEPAVRWLAFNLDLLRDQRQRGMPPPTVLLRVARFHRDPELAPLREMSALSTEQRRRCEALWRGFEELAADVRLP